MRITFSHRGRSFIPFVYSVTKEHKSRNLLQQITKRAIMRAFPAARVGVLKCARSSTRLSGRSRLPAPSSSARPRVNLERAPIGPHLLSQLNGPRSDWLRRRLRHVAERCFYWSVPVSDARRPTEQLAGPQRSTPEHARRYRPRVFSTPSSSSSSSSRLPPLGRADL